MIVKNIRLLGVYLLLIGFLIGFATVYTNHVVFNAILLILASILVFFGFLILW